jgi:hypothetical protein
VDVLLLGLAEFAWMFLEVRGLSARGIWLYVPAGLLVGISIAFLIFLIQRQRMLARREGSAATGALSATGLSGLALAAVPMPGYPLAIRAGQAGHSLRLGVGVIARGRVTWISGFR